MNRLEFAIHYIEFVAFVLIVGNWLIGKYEKFEAKKAKISRIQPRIEVYGRNYKKVATPGRVLNKKC
ncbi:MAG TPA: hypothetical protein VIK78_19630 [Ruminiclostridium sp.]